MKKVPTKAILNLKKNRYNSKIDVIIQKFAVTKPQIAAFDVTALLNCVSCYGCHACRSRTKRITKQREGTEKERRHIMGLPFSFKKSKFRKNALLYKDIGHIYGRFKDL